MGFRKVSRDVKIAAIKLNERGLLELQDILECSASSRWSTCVSALFASPPSLDSESKSLSNATRTLLFFCGCGDMLVVVPGRETQRSGYYYMHDKCSNSTKFYISWFVKMMRRLPSFCKTAVRQIKNIFVKTECLKIIKVCFLSS